jgi:NDP-sugar pyrophosphorylase family protein
MMDEVVFLAEPSEFWLPLGRPEDITLGEKILGAKYGNLDVKAIILAGGKGTRLPAEEQDKPKCLVEIAGKPILAWQFDQLRAQGIYDITLSLGYKAEMVVDWLKKSGNKDVKYVIETSSLGTGGGLKLASEGFTEPFIALNVDDLADVNYRILIRHSLHGKFNVIAGIECSDARAFGTIVHDSDKQICEFREKNPEQKPAIVSIGHYYLRPDVFKDTEKMFSLEHVVFPKLASEKKILLYSHFGSYWLPTNTGEQLERARKVFSSK